MKVYKVYSTTQDCVSSKNEQAKPDIINFEKYFKSLLEAKKRISKYFNISINGKIEQFELVYRISADKKRYNFFLKTSDSCPPIPLNVYIEEIEVEE